MMQTDYLPDSAGADFVRQIWIDRGIGCGAHCRCTGVSAGGSAHLDRVSVLEEKQYGINWVGICFL